MKLLADAETSLFSTALQSISNFFSPDTLQQATIDACAKIQFSNSGDIGKYFTKSGGFIGWYNANLSTNPAFSHRGKINTSASVAARFDAFWDQISTIFGRTPISAVEFAALMSIGIQENSGDLSCNTEKIGKPPTYPGLVYPFEAIAGLKSSYNVNDGLGNWTALKLFNNTDYVAAHSALAGYHQVADNGFDPGWGTQTWPSQFNSDENMAKNGFIMEADFYKLRGRGVIQTTGRDDYRVVIKFIMDNAATLGNPVLTQLHTIWSAFQATATDRLDVIASRSTNAQWEQAFGEGIVLAAAVALDSQGKGDYLQLSHEQDVLNGDMKTPGALYFMAKKINGGNYPATVVPMMKAMMRAIAAAVA